MLCFRRFEATDMRTALASLLAAASQVSARLKAHSTMACDLLSQPALSTNGLPH